MLALVFDCWLICRLGFAMFEHLHKTRPVIIILVCLSRARKASSPMCLDSEREQPAWRHIVCMPLSDKTDLGWSGDAWDDFLLRAEPQCLVRKTRWYQYQLRQHFKYRTIFWMWVCSTFGWQFSPQRRDLLLFFLVGAAEKMLLCNLFGSDQPNLFGRVRRQNPLKRLAHKTLQVCFGQPHSRSCFWKRPPVFSPFEIQNYTFIDKPTVCDVII